MKYLRPAFSRAQIGYRPTVAQPPRRLHDPTEPLPRSPRFQPWPLNEDDIDLPSEPPPMPLSAGLEDVFRGAYLGFVNVQSRQAPGWLTLDLLAEQDHLEIGPYHLDRAAAQCLCVLLSVGLALLDPEPRA